MILSTSENAQIKYFDIIAVSETMITRKTSITSNINLQNHYVEFTLTESKTGGTLLYIANHLCFKPCTDFSLNKANQLEPTFIEIIINNNRSNITVGCLYKHLNMDVSEFNKNYLNTLLHKLSKENKQVFLIGYFNINLLNYNYHQPANEFLDALASKFASNSFILLYYNQLKKPH